VVAVRQLIAAAVLLPTVQPPVRRFTWPQWRPVLLLGLVFAAMNLSLYTAIDRLGLGLAVTLEFLGPLAVALAGTRRLLDLACALGTGVGVYVLVLPDASTDFVGVGFALVAGACWASYVLLNGLAGRRLPGLQATAAASGVSALLYLPVAGTLLLAGQFTAGALLYATTTGVLTSSGSLRARPHGTPDCARQVLRGFHERPSRAGRTRRPGHPPPGASPARGRGDRHRGGQQHHRRQHPATQTTQDTP